MFFQNYDTFTIMTFSYDAFFIFNDLFINNNYLDISKNDKFENCFIIPYEIESQNKINNFKKILENKQADKLIVKNLKIYDYNLTSSFIFNNINELKMNYQKVEFFLEYQDTTKDAYNSIQNKMKYIYKKIKEKNKDKKNIKKLLIKIKEIYYEKDNIFFCSGNTTHLINFLSEYNTEKIKKKMSKPQLK